jgi:hypothetical protein
MDRVLVSRQVDELVEHVETLLRQAERKAGSD